MFRGPSASTSRATRSSSPPPTPPASTAPKTAILVAILERHLADLADEADEAPGLKEKVQSLIGIYLGHKPVTIAAIAAELGLSPRTLQRRLSDAGLSLRDMLRDHRRALAAHHLAAAEAPMSKIAESLGYADSTVFWRARRAWSRRDG